MLGLRDDRVREGLAVGIGGGENDVSRRVFGDDDGHVVGDGRAVVDRDRHGAGDGSGYAVADRESNAVGTDVVGRRREGVGVES